MSKLEHDKLDYLVAIISDFALKFSLSFENVVDDVSVFCRNRGGALV